MKTDLVLTMLCVWVVSPAAWAQSEERPWEPITAERLLDPEDGDWISYRRTYDAVGFSPLDSINRSNVADLRPVWAYSMRDNSRWVPTPIVANGLMYVAEGSGRVVAFDVPSGEVAWIHLRTYPDDLGLSQAYNRHRGVSILEDTVFWGTADSHLVALDARTGEQLWEVRTGDYTTGAGHNHPPLVADGKVIIGFTGGDLNARGEVAAFETETGDLLWRTYTVPAPGEPGSESWAESEMPPLGGATWGTFSYDPNLGLVYVGTGQPVPWATTLRGPGDALYTNSILALDIDTGEIQWHFQVVPADNWDMDTPYESMLVDLTIDGADECDPNLHLIKGGGGALFREKIVASNSAAMVVIADISKEVDCLGGFPLPVEVTRFAWRTTHERILACLASSGMNTASGRLRRNVGVPFVTDEGNLILDYNTGPISDPPGLHAELKRIVGVVETGIFSGLCRMAVFGDDDAKLTIRGSLNQQ